MLQFYMSFTVSKILYELYAFEKKLHELYAFEANIMRFTVSKII